MGLLIMLKVDSRLNPHIVLTMIMDKLSRVKAVYHR